MNDNSNPTPMHPVYETLTYIISAVIAIWGTFFRGPDDFHNIIDRLCFCVASFVAVVLMMGLLWCIISLFLPHPKEESEIEELEIESEMSKDEKPEHKVIEVENETTLCSKDETIVEVVESDHPKEDEEEIVTEGNLALSRFVLIAPIVFFTFSFIKLYQLFTPYSTTGMVVVNGHSWPFEDSIEAYIGSFIISIICAYFFTEIYDAIYNGKDSKGLPAKWAVLKSIAIIILIVLLTIGALYASTHQCEVITEGGYTNYKLTSKEHYSWQEIDYFTFDPGNSFDSPLTTVVFKDGVKKKIETWEFYDYMSKDVEALEDNDDFIEKLFTEKYAHLRLEVAATR